MTYEMYRTVFFGAAIGCGSLFLLTVLLFIFFKIPRIVSDISGRTAKKGIQEIRERNESTGDKTYKTSAVNRSRGKLTDKISPSGRIIASKESFGTGVITEKISTQKLTDTNETEVLSNSETEVLYPAGGETEVLQSNGNETTLLRQENVTELLEQTGKDGGFLVIEREITFIHTQEKIS